jgi:hypothetical protein
VIDINCDVPPRRGAPGNRRGLDLWVAETKQADLHLVWAVVGGKLYTYETACDSLVFLWPGQPRPIHRFIPRGHWPKIKTCLSCIAFAREVRDLSHIAGGAT